MKSVYIKNFLLLAGMILLSFFVFLVSFAVIMRNQTISDKKESLESNADSVVKMYNTIVGFDPNSIMYYEQTNLLVSIVTLSSNQMVVADSTGMIMATSGDVMFNKFLGEYLPDDMLEYLDANDYYEGLTTVSGLFDARSYVYGTSIVSQINGSHGGYVLVASSTKTVTQEWGAIVSLYVFVAFSVLIMAIIIAMIMARHQSAPLREISNAANKYARGDFSARVTDTGRQDEIGELTTAFNAMANSIEKSENMRREFVANVSHELKTPMTSITGFAEGILDGTVPEEKQKDYLQIIASETKRLSRLVRRMLEVSRIQSMEIYQMENQSFDITELLRRGVLGLENKITEKGLDVEMDLPDDAIMVVGEEDSILQVAYNLLDNAIKFAYPGSTIGVGIRQSGEKVYVKVRNTGDTIPQEELPLIFNRFHKSDKSRSHNKDGVGLGLYIVKTIMNTHNEDVYVRSENSVTEFMFTLKLASKKKGKA